MCRTAARILERRQGTGCTAPAGRNSLAPPVSRITYARTPFPQHSPHASGFPAALPGKAKTHRKTRRGGRPDGICRRSSVGVNRRVSKRQRRNPPPHRGQSPLWKNAVTPAMPSTSPLRRILGGGRLWGEPLIPYHIWAKRQRADSPPHFPEKQKHP